MTDMDGPVFADRRDAGRRLATRLREMRWSDPVVFGLARGGIPIALEVAEALGAPLEVAVTRKIGAPGHPEFGVGAVTAGGLVRYDRSTLAALGLSEDDLRRQCERERAEAQRRLQRYRQGRTPLPVADRDVLLVDDGLATGVTARATLSELRAARPRRLVFAAPVCAPESRADLRADADADEVVCLSAPRHFSAVGQWYADFRQTSDEEVLAALAKRAAVS